jgi:hypothetical protein
MMRQFLRRFLGKDMLWHNVKSLERIEIQNRVALAMARAAVTRSMQTVDHRDPESWEFSGFSQHGEDGVIDFLCSKLLNSNRFFVEIGAADGTQNCTSWLAFVRQYGGLMIDADERMLTRAKEALQELNWGVHYISAHVDQDNIQQVLKLCPYRNPDVFSLDIDGIDFYVARAVLKTKYRPKVFVVGYNSAFGPDESITVPYRPEFHRFQEHPSGLYYGVSIAAWRTLFRKHGYEFITTERSGTNAFFIDPAQFPPGFAASMKQVEFRMNYTDQNGATRPNRDDAGDLTLRHPDWQSQFEMIKELPMIHTTSM